MALYQITVDCRIANKDYKKGDVVSHEEVEYFPSVMQEITWKATPKAEAPKKVETPKVDEPANEEPTNEEVENPETQSDENSEEEKGEETTEEEEEEKPVKANKKWSKKK